MTDKAQPKKNRPRKGGAPPNVLEPGAKAQVAPPKRSAARPESKTGKVIALLRRENGAMLEELVALTGWQPHTARAALTGLKKKRYAVSTEKTEGVRRYRVDKAQ